MSEIEDQVGAMEVATNGDSPQTPLQALRARREEVASNQTTQIPVASYEEIGLRAEYRLMDRDEAEKIAKNVKGQVRNDRNEFMYRVLLDTMIAGVEAFHIEQEGVSSPLEGEDGTPITSWMQMAKNLGYTGDTVRGAVTFVFGGNEFAVGAHAMIYNRWMGNTAIDVDDEFLGN